MPDDRRKKKLTDAQQGFVLRRLACGFGLQDTADAVKEEFSVSMSRNAVRYYAEEYADDITELRKGLAEDVSQIPFANKLNRVAHLDQMAKRSYDRRNYSECRAALRQIAEETGEITEKLEHTVTLNKVPVQHYRPRVRRPEEDPSIDGAQDAKAADAE